MNFRMMVWLAALSSFLHLTPATVWAESQSEICAKAVQSIQKRISIAQARIVVQEDIIQDLTPLQRWATLQSAIASVLGVVDGALLPGAAGYGVVTAVVGKLPAVMLTVGAVAGSAGVGAIGTTSLAISSYPTDNESRYTGSQIAERPGMIELSIVSERLESLYSKWDQEHMAIAYHFIDRIDKIQGNGFSFGWNTVRVLKLEEQKAAAQAQAYSNEIFISREILGQISQVCGS